MDSKDNLGEEVMRRGREGERKQRDVACHINIFKCMMMIMVVGYKCHLLCQLICGNQILLSQLQFAI